MLLGLERKWGRSPEPKQPTCKQKCIFRAEEGEKVDVFYDLSQGGIQSRYLEAQFLHSGKNRQAE